MNTAIYMIWEFSKWFSIKSLCDYLDDKNYNSLKGKAQRRSLSLNEDDKKKVARWVDSKIRELIKIKLLIDKQI